MSCHISHPQAQSWVPAVEPGMLAVKQFPFCIIMVANDLKKEKFAPFFFELLELEVVILKKEGGIMNS